MRILLDTSIVIRLGNSATPVKSEVRAALVDAEEILVTSIARAEIGLKLSIGKLTLPVSEAEYWDALVTRLQAAELAFGCEHAAMLSSLPLHHRDPFDRMIAAQCLVEGVSLATTDRIFKKYGVKIVG